MREKYQTEIEKRISEFERDYAFTAVDFADIADTDPANKALSRLSEEGTIKRIIQGVYYKPIYSNLLNEYSLPNIEKVAEALARKFNWTIAPSGDIALNYLHLSTQVPSKWSYISDGPYRKYVIAPYGIDIEFKHCANKEISGRSYITIIVIQALKCIGKNNVQQKDIDCLSKVLKKDYKEVIVKEAITTTAWIYRLIKKICES